MGIGKACGGVGGWRAWVELVVPCPWVPWGGVGGGGMAEGRGDAEAMLVVMVVGGTWV
jgi:hypothetical protein